METANTGTDAEALSQEEKIEILKAMFSTLEVDKKAIFAQWCHEEIEKGASALLGEKMTKMNEQLNSFVAKAYDKVVKTGTEVYDRTNEAFKFANEEEINDSPNSSEGSGLFD
jgi:ElaB/YqjD/DUF883 family membrane-anchored ribosome-binding protein